MSKKTENSKKTSVHNNMKTVPKKRESSDAPWTADIVKDGAIVRTVTVNSISELFSRCKTA